MWRRVGSSVSSSSPFSVVPSGASPELPFPFPVPPFPFPPLFPLPLLFSFAVAVLFPLPIALIERSPSKLSKIVVSPPGAMVNWRVSRIVPEGTSTGTLTPSAGAHGVTRFNTTRFVRVERCRFDGQSNLRVARRQLSPNQIVHRPVFEPLEVAGALHEWVAQRHPPGTRQMNTHVGEPDEGSLRRTIRAVGESHGEDARTGGTRAPTGWVGRAPTIQETARRTVGATRPMHRG